MDLITVAVVFALSQADVHLIGIEIAAAIGLPLLVLAFIATRRLA